MSRTLSSFVKNDEVFVEKLDFSSQKRGCLEAFGIFIGAKVQIFYWDSRKIILTIGKTKLAISQKIAEKIYVRK